MYRNLEATQALIEVLKNDEPEVRWRAARALGHIRDSRAIQPLKAALHDDDPLVRESCAKALKKFRAYEVDPDNERDR